MIDVQTSDNKQTWNATRKGTLDRRAVIVKVPETEEWRVQMGTPSRVMRERDVWDLDDAEALADHWCRADGLPRGSALLKPIQ